MGLKNLPTNIIKAPTTNAIAITSGSVNFISDGSSFLIGSVWHDHKRSNFYLGEPTRALIFNTRKMAREWCRQKRKIYQGRNDCCAKWKFIPVRVRESVKII